MFLQVCGAAREVTGSNYVVEVGQTRFLVDCGMHQGGDKEEALNFAPFPFDPSEIDFVLLTHAHIDHSGRLPRLVREGFSGPIYATSPTCDLAEIMLLDSAYIQEMEAEWRTRKARRAGRRGAGAALHPGRRPQDHPAAQAGRLQRAGPAGSGRRRSLFHDAGHILGSAFLELRSRGAGREGQGALQRRRGPARPAHHPRSRDHRADRLPDHGVHLRGPPARARRQPPRTKLAEILEEAKRDGRQRHHPGLRRGADAGAALLPARDLRDEHDLDMPVYVDSPLASRATEVFRRHPEAFDEEAWKLVDEPGGIFDFPQLHYTASADESRALNGKRGVIIISASGMADAGRIRHHLKHNLWRPEAHVVIVGFQAQGTLGRRLLEGDKRVRIFGEEIAGEGPHPRDHRALRPRRPGAAAGLGLALQAAAVDHPDSRRTQVRADAGEAAGGEAALHRWSGGRAERESSSSRRRAGVRAAAL